MPDFDVFSLLEIRKRKSRSHGIRKKGNGKRRPKGVESKHFQNSRNIQKILTFYPLNLNPLSDI